MKGFLQVTHIHGFEPGATAPPAPQRPDEEPEAAAPVGRMRVVNRTDVRPASRLCRRMQGGPLAFRVAWQPVSDPSRQPAVNVGLRPRLACKRPRILPSLGWARARCARLEPDPARLGRVRRTARSGSGYAHGGEKMIDLETRSAAGLIALTSLRGIGPAQAERLAGRFASLDELAETPPERLRGIVTAAAAESLGRRAALSEAASRARDVLEQADRLAVRILSVHDPAYPNALRRLPDRPPVLYVKGSLDQVHRSVACIGTREPSEFGETVTRRITQRLVAADWTIVSGLAIGIDTLAHATALEHGGRTVAVMAGGLDDVYPKQNRKLAEDILANSGALISEQSFGVPPAGRHLVQRDRLQSGLSVATFVMQTDVKGGSMHTVRFTLLQDRLLFAPAPRGRHAEEPKSRGILALTQLSGRELAVLLRAEGEYERLLLRRHAASSVAIPLSGKGDYAMMLDTLEDQAARDAVAREDDAEGVQAAMI